MRALPARTSTHMYPSGVPVMLKRTLRLTTLGAAIVGAILVASAEAWVTPNHLMYVTFSRSVALPGVQLPSGTYTFEVVAPTIVRVSNRDSKRVYLTTFTRDVARPE